jgi:hypothetical protein
MSRGTDIKGESGNIDPQKNAKYNGKTDKERFDIQRRERNPWKDFWHSMNQIGKKQKPE